MEKFKRSQFAIRKETMVKTMQHFSRQTENAIVGAVQKVTPSIKIVGGAGITIGTISPSVGIISTTITMLALSSAFLATLGAVEGVTGEKFFEGMENPLKKIKL